MQRSSGGIAVLPSSDLDLELDRYVEAFELVAHDGRADLRDYLPPADHPRYLAILCELVRADLEFAWERGEERRLESYRSRFPELFANREQLQLLASEEFRLRQSAGETPDFLEYEERFEVNLSSQGEGSRRSATASSPSASVPETPEVGVTMPPGFVLEEKIGTGSFGSVFRARQLDLAGRSIALKFSTKLVGESQILARLQHSNVVPVYSVHRVGKYTALVMPFLGRTTLGDMIQAVGRMPQRPSSGRELVSTLCDSSVPSGPAATTCSTLPKSGCSTGIESASLTRLGRLSFVESVLWIGSELAAGLAHAHETGILHRDLKPANVLFTEDGRPMLLDFNLAVDVEVPSLLADTPGGTLRYMAPEQIAAFQNETSAASVSSDIYSLCLILFELLTGRLPFEEPSGPLDDVLARMQADRERALDLSALPESVTPAVRSILKKCLAADPDDRYPQASQLRDDLLNQLADRPLQYAPEPSVRERVRKWARRHPRLSSSGMLGTLAVGVLALVVAGFLVRQRGLERLEAERARDDLRTAAASAYAPDGPTGEVADIQKLLARALAPYQVERDDWRNGTLIQRLSEPDRAAVRAEIPVLIRLNSFLIERLAHDERDPARQAALLEEAQRLKQNPAESEILIDHPLSALKQDQPADSIAKLKTLARTGDPRYAGWIVLGTLESKRGEDEAAVESFTTAIGTNPQQPWPYFHRGAARLNLNQGARAADDFDQFLRLRPDNRDGHFNRGLARTQKGDFSGAIADFDRAEQLGFKPNRLYVMRSQAKLRKGDKGGADRDHATALGITPNDPQGWVVRAELRAKSPPPDVPGALAALDEALRLDPDDLNALRDRASLLSESLGLLDQAVSALDQVLRIDPNSVSDRAGRAVLLARLGRKNDAVLEAEACVTSENALTLYQAASVFLITASNSAEKARGLSLLRRALRKDPSWAEVMPSDPDLKSIHSDPRFREIVAAAKSLSSDQN